MRDRRDYVIAALAAALLFSLGLWVGRGVSVLAPAAAQDGGGSNQPPASEGFDPTAPVQPPDGAGPGGGGISINPTQDVRPGMGGRTTSITASDSDSNNRFVAVTCPIGSGESVLFLIDSETEQLTTYRYRRGKGLEFLAGRKIEYDLKITGYQDISEYSYDEMRRLYQKQLARAASEAAQGNRK